MQEGRPEELPAVTTPCDRRAAESSLLYCNILNYYTAISEKKL